jgi:hypothetical protein
MLFGTASLSDIHCLHKPLLCLILVVAVELEAAKTAGGKGDVVVKRRETSEAKGLAQIYGRQVSTFKEEPYWRRTGPVQPSQPLESALMVSSPSQASINAFG